MAVQTTATTGLAVQYQKYFTKKLIANAVPLLKLNDYGMKAKLPKNVGARTVTFFRRNVADATAVQSLTEGVAPTARREVVLTPIDVTLAQYGEVTQITDILSMTQLFDTLENSIELMGQDCALHADGITRNVVVGQMLTANPTGGNRYSQGLANYAALQAASVTAGRAVANDFLDAMTRLGINRAPQIEGGYVAVVPFHVARDLMDDDKWVKIAEYQDAEKIYKGEVGKIYGCKIVVANNSFVENGANNAQGTYDNTGTSTNSIYTSIITGADAWGTVDMAGQSPFGPKIIIVDKPDKTDPLNQTMTAGWKAYWASQLLNPAFCVTLRSKSAFA